MRYLPIAFMALLLLSCGGPGPSNTVANEPLSQGQSISPEQLTILLDNQTSFCSHPDFCPEGVARVYSVNFQDSRKSTTCAGILVGEDKVLTNSHCIWAGTPNLEEACSTLYFSFPSSTGVSHSALCSKIIYRDPQQKGQQSYRRGDNDFALIQLDRSVPHKPFTLKREGMKNGTEVYPLVLDQLTGYSSRVTKLDCRVKKTTKAGVSELENCPIIHGNSGSAILDKDQQLIGIIFASSDNNSRLPGDMLETRPKMKTYGYAYSMDYILSELKQL